MCVKLFTVRKRVLVSPQQKHPLFTGAIDDLQVLGPVVVQWLCEGVQGVEASLHLRQKNNTIMVADYKHKSVLSLIIFSCWCPHGHIRIELSDLISEGFDFFLSDPYPRRCSQSWVYTNADLVLGVVTVHKLPSHRKALAPDYISKEIMFIFLLACFTNVGTRQLART